MGYNTNLGGVLLISYLPANARIAPTNIAAACLDRRRPMWIETILRIFFFLKPRDFSLSTPEWIYLSAKFAGALGSRNICFSSTLVRLDR
jgi:hypothetical protein